MALAPSVCHVGFFTLTTPDNCSDHHEFRQRWRSFNSHYFSQSPHFGHWLATYERQRRGAWHLHVLVLLPYDIRTGVDFTQFALGRYSSAPPYLRAVWRITDQMQSIWFWPSRIATHQKQCRCNGSIYWQVYFKTSGIQKR